MDHDINLYCSITCANNCNNSCPLESSFEKNALHTERLSYAVCMIDPTLPKRTSMHLAKSSGSGLVFILYTTPGALTDAWLVLPLEIAMFPLRQMAVRAMPHTFLTAGVLLSRGDALTFASFCSLLMTASLYAWLSLAPENPVPLPFLFGDSSTFSLSSAGMLWVYLGFQLSTVRRFKDYKMSLCKLHHF